VGRFVYRDRLRARVDRQFRCSVKRGPAILFDCSGVEGQSEKLIPGPRIPMKSPEIKTLTINQKALNGIRPSPTP
jgi:hypothetical protein